MKKVSILALLVIGLLVFVGCDGDIGGDTTLEWTTVATEWTTDDEWQLSFVPSDDGDHIDLGWNETIGDSSTEQRCYLFEENYEIKNNVLSGQYTVDGDVNDTLYDIVITFSYNANTTILSFSCVGEGILHGESFSFYPNPDYN